MSDSSTVGLQKLISFCQSIALTQKIHPYWTKNLSNFDRVFRKNQDNFAKPIREFIKANRIILEAPLINGDLTNDEWLFIPDDEPIPAQKPLHVSKPRGVYLPVKTGTEDAHNHAIPLSEVYQLCGEIKEDLLGVSADTLPARFLELMYGMLLDVESENRSFQFNGELARDAVTMTVAEPVAGIQSFIPALGGIAKKAMESLPPETKVSVERAMNGDLSGLMTQMGPMFATMMKQMNEGLAQMQAKTDDAAPVPAITDSAGDPGDQD